MSVPATPSRIASGDESLRVFNAGTNELQWGKGVAKRLTASLEHR